MNDNQKTYKEIVNEIKEIVNNSPETELDIKIVNVKETRKLINRTNKNEYIKVKCKGLINGMNYSFNISMSMDNLIEFNNSIIELNNGDFLKDLNIYFKLKGKYIVFTETKVNIDGVSVDYTSIRLKATKSLYDLGLIETYQKYSNNPLLNYKESY